MSAHDLDAIEREGWIAVPGRLTSEQARAAARDCVAVLGDDGDRRQGRQAVGRHPSGGRSPSRIAGIAALFEDPALRSAVTCLRPEAAPMTDVGLRCSRPGYGRQSRHADDVPVDRAGECRAVTCIVARVTTPDLGAMRDPV